MAKKACDILNESLYGTSAEFEDFRPALVINCVFNSLLSYTNIFLNIITIHALRKTALLPKPLRRYDCLPHFSSNCLLEDLYSLKATQKPDGRTSNPRSTTGSSKWRLIKLFEASKVSSWNILRMYCVHDLLFAFVYSLFFTPGSLFKSNLLLRSFALYNYFVFPQLVFEPCYILLEDGTHSSHSRGHNARHRQSFQTIAFVMMNCCCKYKLLEISRLLNYADMRTIELSKPFDQVTQLLRNTTKIVLFSASGMFQNTL